MNLPRKSARTIHREQDASSNISFVVACTHIFLDNPAPRDKLGAATASEVLVQYKPYHYAVAVLSMLIFGFSFVWIKVALLGYRPLAIVFVRLVLAGVLLDLLLRAQGRNLRIQPGDHKWFALMAFFEPFVYFLGESFGMSKVSPTLGSVIISIIPLVTPVFAWMLLRERIGRWGIAGLLVCFLGVLATVWEEGLGGGSLLGVGLMFISVFSAVGYTLVVKSLTGRYSPLFIVKMMCQIAALYFAPLFIVFEWRHVLASPVNGPALLAIVKMSLLASAVAYICLTATIRRMGVNNTNLFTFLIPVTAALVSHFALGTAIGPRKAAGILLVGVGIVLSQSPWNRRKEAGERNPAPEMLP